MVNVLFDLCKTLLELDYTIYHELSTQTSLHTTSLFTSAWNLVKRVMYSILNYPQRIFKKLDTRVLSISPNIDSAAAWVVLKCITGLNMYVEFIFTMCLLTLQATVAALQVFSYVPAIAIAIGLLEDAMLAVFISLLDMWAHSSILKSTASAAPSTSVTEVVNKLRALQRQKQELHQPEEAIARKCQEVRVIVVDSVYV